MSASEKTLDLIEQLRNSGQSFCIATVLRTEDSTSARPGAKAVVTPDGDLHGFIGGGCVTGAVRRSALEALEADEPQMIRVRPKNQVVAPTDHDGVRLHKSSCPSGGTVDIFLEPMKSSRKLVICGASPIARAILNAARSLDVQTIIATCPEDSAKMAGADRLINSFDLSAETLTERDAVIVATQGKQDRAALEAALSSAAGYKGMVCSRKKLAKLKADLTRENTDLKQAFSALHAPAGLDIGAIEPEEIGLAVLCEIIADWRRRQAANPGITPELTRMSI